MLLPEEIEKQQFEVSFRGYNAREVDEFLNRIKMDLEEILEEQDILRRKVAAAELIAKDAKDHEEEFIASMQDDKSKVDSILASAKTEGERIIREAKNAAAGIMAEVKRRAGDISAESRRASGDILDSAKTEADEIREKARLETEKIIETAHREADEITKGAAAAADKKTFTARTEADNILKAAAAEAKVVKEEAAAGAALHEKYIKEIRDAAEKLCFELDTELKNSAARIAILGKRIASVSIPENPGTTPNVTAKEITLPQPSEQSHKNEDKSAPAHVKNEAADETVSDTEDDSTLGYFTREYKAAFTELFGEDFDVNEIPPANASEDDDTYDFTEYSGFKAVRITDEDDDDDDEDIGTDGDAVTSEYTGIPSSGTGGDLHDIFSDDTLDRVYRSPSKSDIDDILNG